MSWWRKKHESAKDLGLTRTDLEWLAHRLAVLCPSATKLSQREVYGIFEDNFPRTVEVLIKDEVPVESSSVLDSYNSQAAVKALYAEMGLKAPIWFSKLRPEAVPAIAILPNIGWRIILGRSADGKWVMDSATGRELAETLPDHGSYSTIGKSISGNKKPGAYTLIKQVLYQRSRVLFYVGIAAFTANILALAGSLYSMQVYDRVVPTQGVSTLVVLTTGALIAALFELTLKMARSAIQDRAMKGVDIELGHHVFQRLLGIRMDQFPPSVGSLSSQVRGYETIRAFALAAVLYGLIDVPFAVLFLIVIFMLAGLQLALVPVAFFTVSVMIGMMYRGRIQKHTRSSTMASNKKLGLLVETVEGAESIKATGAGWHQLNRWGILGRESVEEDMKIRHYSEHASYFAAFLQQSSYVVLVCMGAYAASKGDLTTGSIIACSILSGRVLAPVAALPGLIVQWGNAKSSLESLEKVFALEADNEGIASPLVPEKLNGQIKISDLQFSYKEGAVDLTIGSLNIAKGEKVGILGIIGAGKSTLLKLLCGLYKPRQGSVLLDGLDLQHISRAWLSENIGYVPQDIRLLQGTLRDNLTIGLIGISDSQILAACELTGLIKLISSHPKGLDLSIAEGGSGVSGGQKQLIIITRLLLAKPNLWLLDEPTSAMDEGTEKKALLAMHSLITPEQTLILVTHKPALVGLVNRLIVLGPTGILLDGPRDAVLQRLQQGFQQPSQEDSQQAAPSGAERVSAVVNGKVHNE